MFPGGANTVSSAPWPESNSIESKRRRRLSKPQTNKSSGNMRLQALQQMENISKNGSRTDFSSSPLSPQKPSEQPRGIIKAKTFDSDRGLPPSKRIVSQDAMWNGTLYYVSQIEAAHAACHIPPPPSTSTPTPTKKSKRPLSAIFGARRFSRSAVKHEVEEEERTQSSTTGSSLSSASPATSREVLNDAENKYLQRRSSFAPGEATRFEKIRTNEQTTSDALPVTQNRDQGPETTMPARFSFEEEWAPPPRITRCETPADLEPTHLGGLKLGSLQVVNGRASPAPSEHSKHFTSRFPSMNRREVSSEYGGSEAGVFTAISTMLGSNEDKFDTPVSQIHAELMERPRTPKTVVLGARWQYDTQQSSGTTPTPTHSAVPKRKPLPSPDRTSALAQAYMSELPDSPFSARRCSTPAAFVGMTAARSTEGCDDLFDDESLAPSVHSEADHATVDTWYTMTDADLVRDGNLQSTVEFQRQMSPPSLLPPDHPRLSDKSDSGYSSNVSTRDDVSEETKPFDQPEMASAFSLAPQRQEQAPPSIDSYAPPVRPTSILKQSKATAPELPTFRNLQHFTSSDPGTNSATAAAPAKPHILRRLQKRRPMSQPPPVNRITVQGAHLDSDMPIPAIPTEFLANLSIRSQEVPELQQTFNSMHRTRNHASISDISLAFPDVRFPSPEPVVSESEARTRSLSLHRRSLVGRNSPEKQPSKEDSVGVCSQADAMAIIQGGYGNVLNSLGRSPYDSVTQPQSGGAKRPQARTNFDGSWTAQNHPRLMMDDQTAAEVARLRSRAAYERDSAQWSGRRTSFNDRGGVPGKNLRPASNASSAPPIPPLSDYNDSQHPAALAPDQYRPQYQLPHPEQQYRAAAGDGHREPMPPLPKHSPRLTHAKPYTELGLGGLAPSPRSYTIGPNIFESPVAQVDSWAAQAQAWTTRRQTANGMMNRERTFEEHRPDIRPFYQGYNDALRSRETTYPKTCRPQTQNHAPSPEYMQVRRGTNTTSDDLRRGQQGQLPRPTYANSPTWVDQVRGTGSYGNQILSSASPDESWPSLKMEHPQTPTQSGGYSGGLHHGYQRGAGAGGSAEVGYEAAGMRNGIPFRGNYGFDSGNVPIMPGLRRSQHHQELET